jgi:hypothetical protein
MTVRELIKILEQIEDQEIRVMVKGYEQGIDDIADIIPETVNVALDVNPEWWNGSHEVVSEDNTYTDKEIVRAIIIQ